MKFIPENSSDSFQQLGFFVIEKFLSDAEVAQIHAELSRVQKDVIPKCLQVRCTTIKKETVTP